MRAIHQFVPMLHRGDAVGRHTLRLRDLLVARGIDSRIYVELVDPETEADTALATAYPAESRPNDLLVYQFATASDLASWLVGRAETLVVNYHNVTPPELFAAWDNPLARHQMRARAELRLLARRATLGIAVSAYNALDLEEAGFGAVAVVPPAAVLPSVPTTDAAGARDVAARGTGGARWLSVGRMAPNKAIEDVLMGLLVTRSTFDPAATLHLVGKSVIAPYTRALHQFVVDAGLGDAVTFRGHARDEDLADAYARSDVLVVASRHEGFGVPLIEAMSAGLPIVAPAAGALPEVLGAAGVVVDTTDPWAMATAVHSLLEDPARGQALAAAARAQLALLDLPTAGDRMIDLVSALA